MDIYLLMCANLAILHGFGGTFEFVQRAFIAEGGFSTFIGASVWLFCGVMFMLEYREEEARTNQAKKF